jgi:lipid-binding SYLF domain-containing protein
MKGGTDMTNKRLRAAITTHAFLAVLLVTMLFPSLSRAETAKEIDVSVDVALENFVKDVRGAKDFLQASKGVLVFPRVYKAGFWFGGEYGEGALRIGGKTADYYNMASGSFGFQFGAQVKTVILVFIDEDALAHFRKSEGWKAGVDGSVAVVDVGVGQAIDSTTFQQPIIGFIIDQKGLMLNLTLEGSKFTKIKK